MAMGGESQRVTRSLNIGEDCKDGMSAVLGVCEQPGDQRLTMKLRNRLDEGRKETAAPVVTRGARVTRRAVWTNALYWNGPIMVGAHHYARHFARSGWQVAFCSDPISPLHLVKFDTLRETKARFRVWAKGGRWDLDGRLFYYTPFTFFPHYNAPVVRNRWFLDHWHQFSIPRLRGLMKARGFDEPDLLVLDSTIQSFWLDVLRPRKTLMRIVDDLSGFRGVSAAMLDRERELIGRVDHVVYTARRLEAKIAACQPRSMTHVPNGVELAHFLNAQGETPAEYADIPAPRAIYVGAIENWFDAKLLATVADSLPRVSFVVIGPQRTDLSALAKLKNVHVLGPRPYAQVPFYMRGADVGLIPFQVCDLIHSVHPIKLYEYMACGLPVVSVAWDELESLDSPAVLCRTATQFVDATRAALEQPPRREDLIRFASAADWSNRYAQLAQAVGV
jgi:glycosyltransferase involved in cell wall biosynthesis